MVSGARALPDLRFTLEDAMFLRAFHVEIPVCVVHAYWHFDQAIHPDAIADLHRRLADSPLSRRVIAPRIPGARHRWARSTVAPPIRRTYEPLDRDSIRTWIDETTRTVRFDARRGPMWDLSWATVRDGSTVVVLSAPHLAVDGGALIGMLTEIGGGGHVAPLPEAPRRWASVRADMRDAVGRISLLMRRRSEHGGRAPGATERQATPSEVVRIPSRRQARSRGGDGFYAPPWVIAECRAEDLHAIARFHQGTVNGLLIALGATMARPSPTEGPTSTSTEGLTPGGPVSVVQSAVSRRVPGDLWTANTTRSAAIATPTDELARKDLAGIRRRCKAAYADTLAQPTDTRLSVLLQAIPHTAYRRLPSLPPTVVSSYLGTIPPEAATIGGIRAASTTFFASFQCRSPQDLQPIATGPGTWLTLQGDRATLYATALGRGENLTQNEWEAIVRNALDHWEIPASIR